MTLQTLLPITLNVSLFFAVFAVGLFLLTNIVATVVHSLWAKRQQAGAGAVPQGESAP